MSAPLRCRPSSLLSASCTLLLADCQRPGPCASQVDCLLKAAVAYQIPRRLAAVDPRDEDRDCRARSQRARVLQARQLMPRQYRVPLTQSPTLSGRDARRGLQPASVLRSQVRHQALDLDLLGKRVAFVESLLPKVLIRRLGLGVEDCWLVIVTESPSESRTEQDDYGFDRVESSHHHAVCIVSPRVLIRYSMVPGCPPAYDSPMLHRTGLYTPPAQTR